MSLATNNKNDGRRFQNLVQQIADQYARQHILRLHKCDPPTRNFGGRIIYQANPFPDFIGVLTAGRGRMIALEVKSTTDRRLELGREKHGVTRKQCELLKDWHAAGAIGGVLWERPGGVELIPTANLLAAYMTPLKSLEAGSSYGIAVPGGLGFVIHDFARVLLALAD